MVIYTKMKKDTLHGLDKSCSISKRHLDAINKCVKIIKNSNISFKDIILFGSCAKSQSRFNSDIDLMILVNEMPFTNNILELKNVLYEKIEIEDGIKVDLKVTTIKNFNSGENYFYNVIKKDGIILWEN